MRDNWRNEYAEERRGKQNCVLSRKSTQLMREADWNKKYQQAIKKGASNVSIREGTRLTG
jgi:hypothetical protein